MLERFFAGYRAGSKKTMPKKAATARSGAQRNKAKAQKSFEVVRQNAEDQERIEDEQVEATPIIGDLPSSIEASASPTKSSRRAATRASVATQEVETEDEVATPEVSSGIEALPTSLTKGNVKAPAISAKSTRRAATRASMATQEVETENVAATPEVEAAPVPAAKGNSASARLAARRGQKLQPRTPATLVTAEHYSYVKRDLMIIAVLASIMFVAIIVLYFTIGRG
jgi:hypothetical protein